jgi:hypothetical protein
LCSMQHDATAVFTRSLPAAAACMARILYYPRPRTSPPDLYRHTRRPSWPQRPTRWRTATAISYRSGVPFFNVFAATGARTRYAAVIPSFVDAALAGRPLGPWQRHTEPGTTYVGTLAAVVAKRFAESQALEPSTWRSVREYLAEVIRELTRIVGHRSTTPKSRPGDFSQASRQHVCALFGDLQPVPFSEGLRATVDWARSSWTESPA